MATYSPSKITKDGNTYNFTDVTKIPLAGTNALAGSIVPDTDNSYNFGDSSKRFTNMYASNLFTSFIYNYDNTSQVAIYGGTSYQNGAEITAYGKDHPLNGGCVYLVARDGTNTKTFIVKPDGTLTWNGTIIADNTKINAITSTDTNSTDVLYLLGGYSYPNGAQINLYGNNNQANGCFEIVAHGNAQYLKGEANGTLSWTGSPLSTSSDYRLKDNIESISDEVLEAWETLEPKQYKLKSDLENDKDTAQTHYGWIAQDVESVIKGDRKGEVQNGLFTHEFWDEQEEVSHEETYTEESQTKDGTIETVTKTRKVIDQPYKAKGDSYSLRYTECLVVECAYLRKKNKELQEQLNKVIARLDKLEGVQTK